MTQDEIIEMARQAGIPFNKWGMIGCEDCEQDIDQNLAAFAKLVAAKEREGIAQFIDSTELGTLPDSLKKHYARVLSFYSSQIRARGNP